MKNPTKEEKDNLQLVWIIIIIIFMAIVGYLMASQQQYIDRRQDSTLFIQGSRIDSLTRKK